MTIFPEHEKMASFKKDAETIGDFIGWLRCNKIVFCIWHDLEKDDTGTMPEGYYPLTKTTQEWIADFFNIDLKKIDDEKRQMIKILRAQNG